MTCYGKFFVGAFTTLVSVGTLGVAFAQPRTLMLRVQGQVRQAPRWVDSANATLPEVLFDFSQMIQGTGIFSSTPVQIGLVNATSYPATVQVGLPQACTVGEEGVVSESIKLNVNGTRFENGVQLSLGNGGLNLISLEFSQPSELSSGAVLCQQNGSLVYSF